MTAVLNPVVTGPPVGPDVAEGVVLGPYRALDHHFDLQGPAEEHLDALEDLLAPFRDRGASPGDRPPSRYTITRGQGRERFVVHVDGERLAARRKIADLAGPLSWHINRSVIDRSVRRFHLMHASAVTRAGVTVVMPADMESGKTTTAAGLLREGYGYVTDEAVAVDTDTGLVHPFPKRLSLDPGSWPLFPDLASRYGNPTSRQWQLSPGDLGATTATRPVAAPGVIAFPRYVAGCRTEVVPLSRAEAAYELSRMSFHFAQAPARNMRSAIRMASGATVVRLRIGSLDDAVDAVEELVSCRLLEEM